LGQGGFIVKKPDTRVRIGNLELKNPVLIASGTSGFGIEFQGLLDFRKIGGIVTKGISLKPRQGNPPPRIVETPSGMLNSIGLENPGIEAFIKEKIPLMKELHTKIIVNNYGASENEYVELAERCSDVREIDALELNVSCPNVSRGGMEFGQDPDVLRNLARKVVKKSRNPVIVKLSPNVTGIAVIAKAAAEGGCAALSLVNTLRGMAVDIKQRKPILANTFGGLSGPAIKPVALAMTYQAAKAVDLPVIGIGGIMNFRDAIEFFMAGASAVQVGTASFVKPDSAQKIAEGIERYLAENGMTSLKEIIGII
jgi:dihydroorotate dehydrogenase (NAD+) catalytic subunit